MPNSDSIGSDDGRSTWRNITYRGLRPRPRASIDEVLVEHAAHLRPQRLRVDGHPLERQSARRQDDRSQVAG